MDQTNTSAGKLKADQWKSNPKTVAGASKNEKRSDRIAETNKQLDHIQNTSLNRVSLADQPTEIELQNAMKLAVSTPINGHRDRESRWALIENLCQLGAKTTDPALTDANNMTLLHHVAQLKCQRATHSFILKGLRSTPSVKDIVNHRDHLGNTALMYATKNQDLGTVEALIRINADPTIANNAGQTPLMTSVEPITSALKKDDK